jgi:hypothetical protein
MDIDSQQGQFHFFCDVFMVNMVLPLWSQQQDWTKTFSDIHFFLTQNLSSIFPPQLSIFNEPHSLVYSYCGGVFLIHQPLPFLPLQFTITCLSVILALWIQSKAYSSTHMDCKQGGAHCIIHKPWNHSAASNLPIPATNLSYFSFARLKSSLHWPSLLWRLLSSTQSAVFSASKWWALTPSCVSAWDSLGEGGGDWGRRWGEVNKSGGRMGGSSLSSGPVTVTSSRPDQAKHHGH